MSSPGSQSESTSQPSSPPAENLPDAHLDPLTEIPADQQSDVSEYAPQDESITSSLPGLHKQSDEEEGFYDDYELDEDDDGLASRPNRFQGGPNAWRHYTRSERTLHASLRKIQDRDLSAHLYNAYALKRRAREGNALGSDAGRRHSRAEQAFVPPKMWTAWPMPPDEVPREGEMVLANQDEEYTIDAPPDPRPSAFLEDCLIAEILRAAKERFNVRTMEAPADLKGARRRQSAEATRATEATVESAGDANKDDKSRYAQESDPSYLATFERNNPVILADDDKGRQLAQPGVRHILTKLDVLLQNLHRQSEAYRARSRSNSASDGHQSRSRAGPSRSSSPERKSNSRRGRKRARSFESSDDRGRSTSHSWSRSRNQKRPRRASSTYSYGSTTSQSGKVYERRRTREWADVLGTALLSGWSTDVVSRAAKRCAELFSEDMRFRILEEAHGPTEGSKAETFTALQPFPLAPPESDVSIDFDTVSPEKLGHPTADREPRYTYTPPSLDMLLCPVTPCYHTKPFVTHAGRDRHIRQKHPNFKTMSAMDKEVMDGGIHYDGWLEPVRPREVRERKEAVAEMTRKMLATRGRINEKKHDSRLERGAIDGDEDTER